MKRFLNILLVLTCILACAFTMSSCTSGSTACASHTDMDSNGICDVCGNAYTCPGHADVNGDAMCDFCLAPFNCAFHYDENGDEKCDVCGITYICEDHTDPDGDEVCDNCSAPYTCPGHCDVDLNGICDECEAEYTCPGHEDANADKHCDICKAPWICSRHKDSDANGKCDFCKASFKCPGHTDKNSYGRCDTCDMPYTCPGHKDVSPADGVCDVCKAKYAAPVDYRSEFIAAAKTTKPGEVVIKVTTSELEKDSLTSTYTIKYNEDGSFEIKIEEQRYNESLIGDSVITLPVVIITCDAEGNYSDGGEFVGSNPVATGVAVDFSKLKNYSTPDSTTLNATVAKADTAAALGVAFDTDVTLVVNKGASALTRVTVLYANVTITCVYN